MPCLLKWGGAGKLWQLLECVEGRRALPKGWAELLLARWVQFECVESGVTVLVDSRSMVGWVCRNGTCRVWGVGVEKSFRKCGWNG